MEKGESGPSRWESGRLTAPRDGAGHASIKIVFEIGDPAGTSTVALFLKNKSIINSNSLRGNVHTEKSRNRKRLDGTC